MEDKVKKRNIVHLFVRELNLDLFILKHLYGLSKAKKLDQYPEMSFYPDMLEADQTMIQQKASLRKDQENIEKIGPVGTFFAILKGYCCLSMLVIPKAF